MNERARTTRQDYRRRILRVLVHIQHNLDAALPLEKLAEVACFSPFHFHRIFRGLVGESVKQHVRRLRLERAAQRLKHTEQPVVNIAFDAGYEAHESFTRAFQRSFGCSPSEYRARANVPPRIAAPSDVHFLGPDGEPAWELKSEQENPDMNIEIRELPPRRAAFLRHQGPYGEVGKTWERLMDWVGAECLFGPELQAVGMCWDDPEVTPEDKLRYDACVSIADDVQPPEEFGVVTIPGGRYAVALHEGPYDGLGQAYARRLPELGHTPADPPCLELYLNDPNSTEPEDLLTEIYIPLDRGA